MKRSGSKNQEDIPERFRVSGGTLLLDRFMNHFIKLGGIAVILTVFAIFFFILIQVIPLFRGAQVGFWKTESTQLTNVAFMGFDDWMELPHFLTEDNRLFFLDRLHEQGFQNQGLFEKDLSIPDDFATTAQGVFIPGRKLLFGSSDGRMLIRGVRYQPTFPDDRQRVIQASLYKPEAISLDREGGAISLLSYADGGTRQMAAALLSDEEGERLKVVTLRQTRTLMGDVTIRPGQRFEIRNQIEGDIQQILIPQEADSLLVLTETGEVFYFHLSRGSLTLQQRFKPFADFEDSTVASMNFILGDVSVVFSHATGRLKTFSLFLDPEQDARVFGQTKSFPDLSGAASFFSPNSRYKAFLVGSGSDAKLIFNTTESQRWGKQLDFEPVLASLSPRYNGLFFLAADGDLHSFFLDDPHPQAGWRTYFSRIHYEGQADPSFTWQSTGGTDEFERKLSMVPLIIGTLKGTVYAMLFALPIGLLAAIYTSQFLDPRLKKIIKPIMEIMASLPSVVLGFIAALWLAPLVSNQIPSVLTSFTFILLGAIILGIFHQWIPHRFRFRVPDGFEFIPLFPLIFILGWIGWQAGGFIEQLLFVVTREYEDGTIVQVADFRLWWTNVLEFNFETSNAFVVGFVMGFAVIPIIFTISEDAMSNVPESFRTGSYALGASRWQTTLKVVLPTASPGIFSATMIGLGRAIGETMIVVMATGNTPVTDFNIFTGMRTLSANIAVELPEAPSGGTLYRTLFLGALLLFIFTFVVNTVAEVLRQYLREKYKAVE